MNDRQARTGGTITQALRGRELLLRDEGFEAFSQGRLGNAGHNLYVSAAGVLQRIVYSSLTGSGYVDIPFANSHDDAVCVPAYLYLDPMGSDDRLELDTQGAFAGAVGDLTGDGYDDIVIANQYDGATNQVYGQVYFGDAAGFSRKRMLQLWAPSSKDVVIGRFRPDGKPSIVFVSRERVRVFDQGPAGFVADSYTDVDLGADVDVDSIVAADLDGDGIDDLVVRSTDSSVRVFWGGEGGIATDRVTRLDRALTGDRPIETELDPAAMGAAGPRGESGEGQLDEGLRHRAELGATGLFVRRAPTVSRLKIVDRQGRPELFLCPDSTTRLVRFGADRSPSLALSVESGPVMSAAVGDLTGTGEEDLVLVSRQEQDGRQFSMRYRLDGTGATLIETFETASANDAVIADLDGDGRGELIVCQDQLVDSYTSQSLVLSDVAGELVARAVPTHCALDVLLVRWPTDGLPKPVFVNHLSNTVLGNVESHVYLGGPDGYSEQRRLSFRGWAATELKYVDFTDSGVPDVFMANSNENWLESRHGSCLYYRDGDPQGSGTRTELPTHRNMSGLVADLDRNGYLDLIALSWSEPEFLVLPGGPAGFGEPQRVSLRINGKLYDQPRYASLADLNRDGWLDLVVPVLGANAGTLIYWGGPDGFSPERATVLPSGTATCVRIADLDGDGWLDLVVAGFKGDDPRDDYRTFVYIYWGGPEGYSNERRTQLPAYFPTDVSVGDLNKDGNLDIVVANYHGHQVRDLDSVIYWGGPDGDFHPHRLTRLFHHSACGILLADFDEDGYLDLAVANHKTYGNHPGESYLWYSEAGEFPVERRVDLPTSGPHGLMHLDLGNVYDRSPEEHFESRVFTLPGPGRCRSVTWEGQIPAKTWVAAQVRCAESEDLLDDREWIDVDVAADVAVSGFLQYRLSLGATNSVATPRITRVEVSIELVDT